MSKITGMLRIFLIPLVAAFFHFFSPCPCDVRPTVLRFSISRDVNFSIARGGGGSGFVKSGGDERITRVIIPLLCAVEATGFRFLPPTNALTMTIS